ncbi:hypothetical protein SHKM778_05540 [Streptomyces sp. KM77-8]|uniref:SAM-dependent methyltransferase n=1 Tax=Streptomyces haneummycinicus TaxID=3074435 RepID=A0AAT9H9W6_9ACTN
MTTSGAADEVTHTTRAHSFNAAAAQYAASRPSYPPALFDTVEALTGRPSPAPGSWTSAPVRA